MIFQESVGISYTLQCPFACAHCITFSSPRNHERMQLQQALRYVQELSGVVNAVCFTGGEVFIHYADLLRLIEEAITCGLFPSVMTNAFWATNSRVARATVKELKRAGLKSLGISLDTFHRDYVREDRALIAAKAAAEAGITTSVRVVKERGDTYFRRVRTALRGTGVEVECKPVTRLGRAAVEVSDAAFVGLDVQDIGPCDTVSLADVLPDGKVTACCGPGIHMATENPLVLGNAEQESLSAILRRSRQNKFMMMMNLYGPAGLFRMLPKKTRLELQTERYTDVCSLCLSITNTPEYVRILKTRLTAEDTSVRLSAGMLLRDVDRHLSLDRKMTANSQHRADF